MTAVKTQKRLAVEYKTMWISSQKINAISLVYPRGSLNRLIANISGVTINEVSTGKFVDDSEKERKVKEAVGKLESVPYSYVSVAGKPFEQILNIIRRWIVQEVKTDESGKTNECLIIYDYLKLMS